MDPGATREPQALVVRCARIGGCRFGCRIPQPRSHACAASDSGSDSAGAVLGIAGEYRPALAEAVARQAREVALATLSGETAVEVAIVDRDGGFLARVGGPAA